MKTGYIISTVAHALILALVLFGSFWQNRAPREAVIAPVEVIDSNAFDTLVAQTEALRGANIDPDAPLPDQDANEEVIGEDSPEGTASEDVQVEDVASEDVTQDAPTAESPTAEPNISQAQEQARSETVVAPEPVDPNSLPTAELPAPRASLAFIRPPVRRPENLNVPDSVENVDDGAQADTEPEPQDAAQEDIAEAVDSAAEAQQPEAQQDAAQPATPLAPETGADENNASQAEADTSANALEALDTVPLPPSRDPARLTQIASDVLAAEVRQASQESDAQEAEAAAIDAAVSETVDAATNEEAVNEEAPEANENADAVGDEAGAESDAESAEAEVSPLDNLSPLSAPPRRPNRLNTDVEPASLPETTPEAAQEADARDGANGDVANEAAAIAAAVENVVNEADTEGENVANEGTAETAPTPVADPTANLPRAVQPPRRPNLQGAAERVRVEAAARAVAATPNVQTGSGGSEADAIDALLSQVAGEGERRALSGNELAAIGAKIGQYWNQTLLREKPNYENLIVRISVPVLKSGAIGGTISPVEPANPQGDFLFAYEEARRAVSAAAPLPLPQDIFKDGDILILRFDPKNGIGI